MYRYDFGYLPDWAANYFQHGVPVTPEQQADIDLFRCGLPSNASIKINFEDLRGNEWTPFGIAELVFSYDIWVPGENPEHYDSQEDDDDSSPYGPACYYEAHSDADPGL